jgi:hypothetical protein
MSRPADNQRFTARSPSASIKFESSRQPLGAQVDHNCKAVAISRTSTSTADATHRERSVTVTVVLIVVGLGYAWVASGVRTFTHPAEALTGLPIIAVAVGITVARRARGGRRLASDLPARRLAGWFALAVVLFLWEMRELFASPRHDYPTMSSIGDAVLRNSRLTHALAFALWLAAGAFLVRSARPVRAP